VPPPGRAFLRAGCRCNLCLRAQGICICPTCTERRFSDSDYAVHDGADPGRESVESMWFLPEGYKPATS